MNLYELFQGIADILTPTSHSFYGYLLYALDDNGGFYRTRSCYWEKPIEDRKIHDTDEVLICFKSPFTEGDEYYLPETPAVGKKTIVKIQLFPHPAEDDAAWSEELGYKYVCKINLAKKSFEWIENTENYRF